MEQAEKYWVFACSISYGNTSDYYLNFKKKNIFAMKDAILCVILEENNNVTGC